VAERAALAWCPFPDPGAARSVARTVVEERLAACANIFPGIESLFAWRGGIETGAEAGALFKTEGRLLAALIARLAELHPYETPAISGWHCDATAPATLAWLSEVLGTSDR